MGNRSLTGHVEVSFLSHPLRHNPQHFILAVNLPAWVMQCVALRGMERLHSSGSLLRFAFCSQEMYRRHHPMQPEASQLCQLVSRLRDLTHLMLIFLRTAGKGTNVVGCKGSRSATRVQKSSQSPQQAEWSSRGFDVPSKPGSLARSS